MLFAKLAGLLGLGCIVKVVLVWRKALATIRYVGHACHSTSGSFTNIYSRLRGTVELEATVTSEPLTLSKFALFFCISGTSLRLTRGTGTSRESRSTGSTRSTPSQSSLAPCIPVLGLQGRFFPSSRVSRSFSNYSPARLFIWIYSRPLASLVLIPSVGGMVGLMDWCCWWQYTRNTAPHVFPPTVPSLDDCTFGLRTRRP